MKTTIIALFTLSLAVFSTKNNISECYDTISSESLYATTEVINVSNEVYSDDCYDVYFDPAVHSPESIQNIRQVFFQGQIWYASPNQPANYPYHQVWCVDEDGRPGGNNSEEEEEIPNGVTFILQTNNQG